MPYQNNKDLPDNVKNNLPDHAQAIYREAFNSAFEEYENPKKRSKGGSREEVAHRVAWAAVKKKYRKNKDKWIQKNN